MHWRFILRIIGILSLLLAATMSFPIGVGLLFEEATTGLYTKSMAISAGLGLVLLLFTRNRDMDDFISQKEGMVAVALSWAVICLLGALPFFFSPWFSSFTDAVFESVSGFTTTGSSILTDIEATAKSLLFWRSLIQWLGGMGIIVLSLAVLPFLGVGGIQLYKAEVPSPEADKLTPRLSDSAKILWMVYLALTLAETGFLYFGGLSLYDSLCHALTTLPTGGFSPKNASVAAYDSAYVDWVITIFMVLAGINFTLHFLVIKGRPLAFFRDTECRVFLGLVLVFSLIITWDVYGSVYDSMADALRFAGFQVASIVTTTGFASADYETFSGISHVLLFICMFAGASAGSTGGGIKISRIIICFKYCYRELFKILHPRSVSRIRMDGNLISDELIQNVLGFMVLYVGIFILASILLAALGLDLLTAFSAAASCLGNIGPGFGTVGPTENFAHLPQAAKWILSLCMLLGRLELYTVIILFVPAFWRD